MIQRKAFVTGSSGMLGARLVFDLYNKGYKIFALVRSEASIINLTNTLKLYTNEYQNIINTIVWLQGDVLDQLFLFEHITSDMDVYHCAAMVSFNPKRTNTLFETNVTGTANIVNACIENKVRKLCHVSSIGALGSSVNGSVIDVDSPWSSTNKSPYSKSKHNSEMEVWRGIAEGLNAVIVNPAVILGAGEWNSSSATLFSKVNKGMKFYTLGTTGYVYVNDVCKAMITLMESDISEKRFVLSAETLSYKSIFEKIANALQVKEPTIKANKLLTGLAWRLEKLRIALFSGEPLISRYTHKTAHTKSNYNGSPIKQAINFKYTPIDAAIKEIAELFNKKVLS